MQPAEIKAQVQRKRFLIDSFLFTTNLNYPASPDAALRHNVTTHFLQAVILELIIKILFELDNNKAAPFTHNLVKIYRDIRDDTKVVLTKSYNEARERRRIQFTNAKIEDVQFHPLDDVLSNNEKTVKNFKYDAMGVKSNSSVDGVFYSEVFKYIDERSSELDV